MTSNALRLQMAQLAARLVPLAGAHVAAGKFYSWELARSWAETVRRRSLTGSSIDVNTADEYGFFFATRGCYDYKVLAVAMEVCRPGDTIVEVGANIGTETVGFADIIGPRGRVIAFEPLPSNLETLGRNTRELPQVTVEPLAVSDTEGEVEFVLPVDGNSGVGHFWGIDQPESSDAPTVRVRTVTLDRYLADRPMQLLMMDAEGAEPNVLEGAREVIGRDRPVVVLEAHHHRPRLLKILESMGYAAHSIERWGLRPPKADPDAVQYNWLALHESAAEMAGRIDRTIHRCGLLPALPGIHPLVGIRRRTL